MRNVAHSNDKNMYKFKDAMEPPKSDLMGPAAIYSLDTQLDIVSIAISTRSYSLPMSFCSISLQA